MRLFQCLYCKTSYVTRKTIHSKLTFKFWSQRPFHTSSAGSTNATQPYQLLCTQTCLKQGRIKWKEKGKGGHSQRSREISIPCVYTMAAVSETKRPGDPQEPIDWEEEEKQATHDHFKEIDEVRALIDSLKNVWNDLRASEMACERFTSTCIFWHSSWQPHWVMHVCEWVILQAHGCHTFEHQYW